MITSDVLMMLLLGFLQRKEQLLSRFALKGHCCLSKETARTPNDCNVIVFQGSLNHILENRRG